MHIYSGQAFLYFTYYNMFLRSVLSGNNHPPPVCVCLPVNGFEQTMRQLSCKHSNKHTCVGVYHGCTPAIQNHNKMNVNSVILEKKI